ncbi:hypothetical protein AGIG_G3111 [Arapaima gigas]
MTRDVPLTPANGPLRCDPGLPGLSYVQSSQDTAAQPRARRCKPPPRTGGTCRTSSRKLLAAQQPHHFNAAREVRRGSPLPPNKPTAPSSGENGTSKIKQYVLSSYWSKPPSPSHRVLVHENVAVRHPTDATLLRVKFAALQVELQESNLK